STAAVKAQASGPQIPNATSSGNFSIPPITVIDSLEDLISLIAQLLRPLFILTFIGVILYAAYLWMISRGNSDQIEKARRTIVAAIIGLTLAVFAPAITSILASFLGVDTL